MVNLPKSSYSSFLMGNQLLWGPALLRNPHVKITKDCATSHQIPHLIYGVASMSKTSCVGFEWSYMVMRLRLSQPQDPMGCEICLIHVCLILKNNLMQWIHSAIHMYLYMHMQMHMCVCTRMHIYIYIYACVYICKYLYICIYICKCIYICVYICICVYVYMCMYVYIYVHMYIYDSMLYMYICIYVYMFFMYMCIYMYICMWQWPLGSISFVGLERHLLQSNERYSKHLYNRARLSEALDVDRRQ